MTAVQFIVATFRSDKKTAQPSINKTRQSFIVQVTGIDIQRIKSYVVSWRLHVGLQVYEQVIAPNFFVFYPVFLHSKMSMTIYVKK